MSREIELIGAAWGLGGADPACAQAPRVLMPQLAARLADCGARVVLGPTLEPDGAERRKQAQVSRLCARLAATVAGSVRAGRLPCVLGGDHSCAGGTWTGVARGLAPGALGLVWVDAHMDSHTPATSHTGRLHGMPLAWLLGEDDHALYGLSAGVVAPADVALVGVRSYEPEEAARLEQLAVRVFHMEEVERRGLPAVFAEALAIAMARTARFGVSIDLDAVTPDEAPAVGTPVRGGVGGAELAQALAGLAARPQLAALELVEYSPRLDADGRTARLAVEALAAALCRTGDDPQVLADALERPDG
ncbi:MAG TPA: arginase [Burkholderiales bacterium]|nr:arginase [Burkholderiales bacterium]